MIGLALRRSWLFEASIGRGFQVSLLRIMELYAGVVQWQNVSFPS
jgi:hypothetical protein